MSAPVVVVEDWTACTEPEAGPAVFYVMVYEGDALVGEHYDCFTSAEAAMRYARKTADEEGWNLDPEVFVCPG